jgi:hypothetical protein
MVYTHKKDHDRDLVFGSKIKNNLMDPAADLRSQKAKDPFADPDPEHRHKSNSFPLRSTAFCPFANKFFCLGGGGGEGWRLNNLKTPRVDSYLDIRTYKHKLNPSHQTVPLSILFDAVRPSFFCSPGSRRGTASSWTKISS